MAASFLFFIATVAQPFCRILENRFVFLGQIVPSLAHGSQLARRTAKRDDRWNSELLDGSGKRIFSVYRQCVPVIHCVNELLKRPRNRNLLLPLCSRDLTRPRE